MARLNLLQSAYTGKLGETIGQRWKGEHILRSRPMGKAPMTDAQKSALSLFTVRMRILRTMLEVAGDSLRFNSRKMTRLNMLCHKNKEFMAHDAAGNLALWFGGANNYYYRIASANVPINTTSCTVNIGVDSPLNIAKYPHCICMIYNNDGYLIGLNETDITSLPGNLIVSLSEPFEESMLCVIVGRTNTQPFAWSMANSQKVSQS